MWEPILQALEKNKVVKLSYEDEKQRKGLRISLGRRASNRGLTLEIRDGDGYFMAKAVNDTSKR